MIWPPQYRWLAGGLLVAGAVGAVLWWGHARESRGYKAGEAAVTARWQAEDLKRAAVAATAQEEARAEEARRQAAQQEVIDEFQRQAERARADAVIASAAAGRLQQRVAALLAAARSGQAGSDPSPSSPSAPAEDAARVLADVLGRCVARAELLARIADERGAAGTACERAYDALTVSTTQPDAETGAAAADPQSSAAAF
jgi:hypothetical protein